MTGQLSITEVADKFHVTKRTIRYYEELGLIHPKRSAHNRRLFTTKDLTRLGLVLRGKKYGFQLDEIKEMFELFDQDPSGEKQLEHTLDYGKGKMKEIDIRIRELEQLKAEMNHWLIKCEKELRGRRGESS